MTVNLQPIFSLLKKLVAGLRSWHLNMQYEKKSGDPQFFIESLGRFSKLAIFIQNMCVRLF